MSPAGQTQKMVEGPLKPGTRLPDGTTIGEYIGRSPGALSFYGEHPEAGRVVVRVLAPAVEAVVSSMGEAFTGLTQVRHRSLQRLVSLGTVGPRRYVTFEYIEGRTLKAAIARRVEARGPFSLEAAFSVMAHATAAVEVLHEVAPHAALTSENVYVERDGKIRICNLGFGWASICALGPDSDAFRESAFIAPEIRMNAWSLSEAADVYSLGVILVAMLSGQAPQIDTLPALATSVAATYPALGPLLEATLAPEPAQRLSSPAELRQALATAMGEAVRKNGGESDKPFSTVTNPAANLEALFGGAELPPVPTISGHAHTEADYERWVVQISGRDYGPFTAARIHEMLRSDEIDENTSIFDLNDPSPVALIDSPSFTDFVMDYLPERAKKRLKAEERRDQVVRDVKRTSTTTILAATFAAAVGAALLFVWRSETPPVQLESAFVRLPYRFVVAEPSYTEIEADNELLASLFDFREPGAAVGSAASPPRPSRAATSAAPDEAAPPSAADYVVDFDGNAPSRKLTRDELNSTLRRSTGDLQECFQKEIRANPGFRGVTVNVSIIPDGRVSDSRIDPVGTASDELETCLTRVIRRVRFPEFNDIPMNVSFPFRL